jgi:hypothetical protein
MRIPLVFMAHDFNLLCRNTSFMKNGAFLMHLGAEGWVVRNTAILEPNTVRSN